MNIQMIPLNKLVPSPDNVRKTGTMDGIDELAASIAALGLLQNLRVRPGISGKFEVVAGMRRLAALKRLAKQKMIGKTEAIACDVQDGNGTEASLAENLLRLPMHPADQYDAFKVIADQGKGPEEIAARFGCSPTTVRQRLKLAAVSPSLIERYRSDELDLDQLMAFAVSDDHAAQERVWNELPAWSRNPHTIRQHLTQGHVDADDRRVQFVGMAAYEAAGGHVLRDLFQPDHEGYLTDPALLDRLVATKLEQKAEAIRAEGWQWVEIAPDLSYERMRRVHPECVPPTEEQQAEIARLSAERERLYEEEGGDDAPEAVLAEIDALADRIEALEQGTEHWLPEDAASAGAMIAIGYGGRLVVQRGLVRPDAETDEDQPRKKTRAAKREGALSDRVVENLTAHRTAALRALLAGNSDVALTSVVHALVLPVFFPHEAASCLQLRLHIPMQSDEDDIENSVAVRAFTERHAVWQRRLPKSPDELWGWLSRQDNGTRLDLLAHCAACGLNAVRKRHEAGEAERFAHADRLAEALALDMAQWWQPTAKGYLAQVPKALILDAVREGVTSEAAENLAKLKKDALAAEAEKRLSRTGWLPPILRAPASTDTVAALDALAAE